jgi:hypothetical protein
MHLSISTQTCLSATMGRHTSARPDSDALGGTYQSISLECTIPATDFQQEAYRPLILGDSPVADNHVQANAVDEARLGPMDLHDTHTQATGVDQDLHPSREDARLVSQQAGLEGAESGSFTATSSQDQHLHRRSNHNDLSPCADLCSFPSMHPPGSLSLPNHEASREKGVLHLEKGDSQSGAHSNPPSVSEYEPRDSSVYPIPFIKGPPTNCWPCKLDGESIYAPPPRNNTPTLAPLGLNGSSSGMQPSATRTFDDRLSEMDSRSSPTGRMDCIRCAVLWVREQLQHLVGRMGWVRDIDPHNWCLQFRRARARSDLEQGG